MVVVVVCDWPGGTNVVVVKLVPFWAEVLLVFVTSVEFVVIMVLVSAVVAKVEETLVLLVVVPLFTLLAVVGISGLLEELVVLLIFPVLIMGDAVLATFVVGWLLLEELVVLQTVSG